MKKIIRSFAIEVTRRCNQSCRHCMRGEAQNIDINKYYIDLLFEKDMIIQNLVFSGGEPTLCEDLIIYIIDEIINKHKLVLSIYMATNGIIYSDKILRAFSKYAEYATKSLNDLYKIIPIPKRLLAVIELSNDQFHEKIDIDFYKRKSNIYSNVTILSRGISILTLTTGNAKTNKIYPGLDFNYKLNDFCIELLEDNIIFGNAFYLTTTGFITNNGDGRYIDMDKINLGKIEDFSFENLYKQEDNNIKKKHLTKHLD